MRILGKCSRLGTACAKALRWGQRVTVRGPVEKNE